MTKKSAAPKFERIPPGERRALLVEASIACLAKGGIQGFTVDNICAEAGTSRGLITHHFGSKNALLAAAYAAIYGKLLENLDRAEQAPESIDGLVGMMFADSFLSRDYLNVWLALWGEIAVNPALQLEHRKNYALYRERIARAISAFARGKGVTIDSYDVATILISLVDGLWLEQCIDQSLLSLDRAKDLCRRTLAAVLAAPG
ncbi:MAG: TetR family transcriptional regulator C-terminal domain-containing protein [Aestuariivirga sp.]|uniref:TetR/AcrR family transcriptional regulator n=1 Tax=Aestuariivirga sp. TaxID=2650926 RepID=UPI0025BEA32F|nr:TetR/AcrR family transcriptional regulator [Aestuariivirga sp.]MCA3560837.1 TetR family transcriptional regulator C-terminal domain-containing protein [Aestuariivirga sp.]